MAGFSLTKNVTSLLVPGDTETMFALLSKTDRSPALCLIRLALGLVLLPAAARNTLAWFGGTGASASVELYASVGFPSWLTILLLLVELLVPILLLAGLFTRVWALAVIVATLVQIRAGLLEAGFLRQWTNLAAGDPLAFQLLVLAVTLALLLAGGGALSLDRKLAGGGRRGGLVL